MDAVNSISVFGPKKVQVQNGTNDQKRSERLILKGDSDVGDIIMLV